MNPRACTPAGRVAARSGGTTSARHGGVRRLEGSVLADNEPMRALMRARGWRIRRDPEDAHLVIAWLDLEPPASAPSIGRDFARALS